MYNPDLSPLRGRIELVRQTTYELLQRRLITDGSDKIAWLKARSQGVTASDAAKLATDSSVISLASEKMRGGPMFSGRSSYLQHGRNREPVIADWVRTHFDIIPSSGLFHAEGQQLHLATPDGVSVEENGSVVLCEIKTTSKPWRSIPKNYLRQIWWQQYVLGAERTLLVWEEHKDFVPISDTPQYSWIDRDDSQITALIQRADELLRLIREMSLQHQRHSTVS